MGWLKSQDPAIRQSGGWMGLAPPPVSPCLVEEVVYFLLLHVRGQIAAEHHAWSPHVAAAQGHKSDAHLLQEFLTSSITLTRCTLLGLTGWNCKRTQCASD